MSSELKKINFKLYEYIDNLLGFTDLIPYNYYVLKNDFSNIEYYNFIEEEPQLTNVNTTRLLYLNEMGVDSFYGRTFYDEDNDYNNIRQLFHDFLISINVVPSDRIKEYRTVYVTDELIERYFYDQVWDKYKNFNILLVLGFVLFVTWRHRVDNKIVIK